MKNWKVLLQVLVIISYSVSAKESVISFGKAKNLLSSKVYGAKNRSFYCDCEYQKKSIKGKTCKIYTKKHKKRSKRLEWEHVVPAHAFGQSFKEWREPKTFCPKKRSPRKCAAKKNKLFKEMEGNLHNLVPSVGSINAVRSNYSFAELTSQKLLCEKGVVLDNRKVMPPKNRKGDIARIYFYMDNKYPNRGIISNKNKKLFEAWNKIDPVDEDECYYSKLKAKLQGDENEFVMQSCKKK